MFWDSSHALGPCLHRNEEFHYAMISKDYQLYTFPQERPDPQVLSLGGANTYNLEPASSFEIAPLQHLNTRNGVISPRSPYSSQHNLITKVRIWGLEIECEWKNKAWKYLDVEFGFKLKFFENFTKMIGNIREYL